MVYAILRSFAFDAIYWQKIDQRFFGPTETDDPSEAWKERLNLLGEDQKAEMERLVGNTFVADACDTLQLSCA